jgi:RNA polymerase sigma-70 factor (ECF subfamily)
MLAEKEALLIAGAETVEVLDSAPTAVAAPYGLLEARLVARLKAGEMSAFDELVEEYQPLVYGLSYRVLNDAEDARDATQETFLKVYRYFVNFRGEASLKTWICRIAINQARSSERWWRRRFRKETFSLDSPLHLSEEDAPPLSETLASLGASPETDTLQRERGRSLERALVALKKDFRIAVILRDIEGLTYEDIAYVTETNVGTVKSRIARGREMLREMLSGQ